MFEYVFVYSRSTFRVTGEHPLKLFLPERSYDQAQSVIDPGGEVEIDVGIYGIWSDPGEPSGLLAVRGTINVDYDRISANDKDPWPTLVGWQSSDRAMRERVLAAFPTLVDEQLKGFFLTQGVSAA